MPSGRTHDRLTWLSTLPVSIAGWLCSQNLIATACLAGSFLFAGLMFSGDLDTKSVQYKRWGWFRWIWIPYRRCIPHRSPFSHGPVLGMLTRLFYLSVWILVLFAGLSHLSLALNQTELALQSQALAGWVLQKMNHPLYAGMGLAGLWLGGFSHTLADETVSWIKRWQRRSRRQRRPQKHKKH